MHYGIGANRQQLLQQLLQVFLVGMTLGSMRTVVPALAESEFAVPRDSFLLLTAFVVAFGVVKAAMNFLAGRWAERIGRRRMLIVGWAIALPIPWLLYFAASWNWIVAATWLLGIHQGIAWSMTQTAKLDLTRADQRGLVIGLNEFAGYAGVALAGLITAWLAARWGARDGLLWFGSAVIVLALLLTLTTVRETLPWARQEAERQPTDAGGAHRPRYPELSETPNSGEVFRMMSGGDRRMAAFCQAGLVEKFVDALVWIFWPIHLHRQGVGLPGIGGIVGIYGLSWGLAQLATGRLSDRLGRMPLNVGGMFVCGAGVVSLPLASGVAWWSASAALTGLGMAMLYPNLSAAVADISAPRWRASAIGVYRFWRDFGYAFGALALGLTAMYNDGIAAAFWFVGAAMWLSGALLWWWGEETRPRLPPPAP